MVLTRRVNSWTGLVLKDERQQSDSLPHLMLTAFGIPDASGIPGAPQPAWSLKVINGLAADFSIPSNNVNDAQKTSRVMYFLVKFTACEPFCRYIVVQELCEQFAAR
jgi:hypothetical protein